MYLVPGVDAAGDHTMGRRGGWLDSPYKLIVRTRTGYLVRLIIIHEFMKKKKSFQANQ